MVKILRRISVKLAKVLKKGDKIVSDSQERAYWRIHRPPPGMVSSLEQCPVPNRCRNGSRVRKRTIEDCKREVELLKNSLLRTRVKVSQALESMMQHVETYAEYDPLIVNTQPSNPWVSEDLTYWQLNSPLVEIPTEKRVRRWGLSMEELVSDPTGIQEFTNYLRKEYSHENIRFWMAVNDLRRSSQSQIQRKVSEIFDEFLAPGAPCEINIDGKTMEKVHQEMKSPSRFTFDAAQEHVYTLLLKKDCYPRFIRSEYYKSLLASGIQPSQKKRFFGFGPTKKKASTSSAPNPSLLQQQAPPTTIVGCGALSKRRGSDRSLSGSAHELAISGVRDTRVPHSHSQSNLSDIPYRGDLPSQSKGSSAPLPSPAEVNDEYGGTDPESSCRIKKPPSVAVVASVSTSEDVCPWEVTPEPHSRKNSSQMDSCSSSSDISAVVTEVSDRFRRTCGITQQSTLDGGQSSRKLSTVSFVEQRRASVSVPIRHSDIRPSVSSFEESSPAVFAAPVSLAVASDTDNKTEEFTSTKTFKKSCSLTKTCSVTGANAPIISVSSVTDDTVADSIEHKEDDEAESSLSLPLAPLAEPDAESASSDTPLETESRPEPEAKSNDVCPWEDEETCKVDAPFVKTYATLGYL
ncbi:uncharacterized protein LOC116182689 [Photinus pyralis]|uniref:uncharacterized protein LOC116182689 n=1 Tax=Photinus pyralis TaxID=7054 RepID=UPI001266EBE7|nr:uncharacterized protein LOC116182689 [Photinus pyralis]